MSLKSKMELSKHWNKGVARNVSWERCRCKRSMVGVKSEKFHTQCQTLLIGLCNLRKYLDGKLGVYNTNCLLDLERIWEEKRTFITMCITWRFHIRDNSLKPVNAWIWILALSLFCFVTLGVLLAFWATPSSTII